MAEKTNRLDRALATPRTDGRRSVWPFIPAGYPDLSTTAALIREFDRIGAAGVEIGFPYSDSIADGPVIQDAFTRALAAHVRIADVLAMVAAVRRDVSLPLLAMVSAPIVYRFGVDEFVEQSARAGFDALIVPDVTLEEAPALSRAAASRDLRFVMLVAPTTPRARFEQIAAAATGFLYYVSIAGVTGERAVLPSDLRANLSDLQTVSTLPILVGFGISRPEHIREVCRMADGAIVGSAIVRRMMAAVDAGKAGQALVGDVSALVQALLTG